MISLESHLTQSLSSVFKDLGLGSHPVAPSVVVSDRPDLCDYQSNIALVLSKHVGCAPRDLAEFFKEALIKHHSDIDVSIAGPGFLNFRLSDAFLRDFFEKQKDLPYDHSPSQTVIIDYGGPNVAKPMHVGHLRSSIIGESLKRLFIKKGHNVIGDIHLGDWGTQMGMLIMALEQEYPELPYFDAKVSGPYSKDSPVSLEDLQEIYPRISAACAADAALADKARRATYELQQGRPGYKALWQHFVDVSVADMKKNFERLNVSFDQWFGESRYQDSIPHLMQQLKERGLIQKSQGASVIYLAQESDEKEMPPLILEKSDGGFLYATTDLATLDERVQIFKADWIVYVVDGRQRLHFEQLFRAAQKIGYIVRTDFIGFGTMNGSDNKPFKTRSGGAMRLEELIDTLKAEALEKMQEAKTGDSFSEEELERLAEKIGVAALKFADLQHNPTQNYQFDLKKFMSFEGKTGPYLLYALVRIASILKKTETSHSVLKTTSFLPQERELFLKLLQREEVIDRAYKALSPHIICDYAFELAQSFSRFYQGCPILSEQDFNQKETRIFLCHQVAAALNDCLYLLGITPVDRM